VPVVRNAEDHAMPTKTQPHRIEEDLATWLQAWVDAGLDQLEDYLAKHAAFDLFLHASRD
jgi:hypothetical protein